MLYFHTVYGIGSQAGVQVWSYSSPLGGGKEQTCLITQWKQKKYLMWKSDKLGHVYWGLDDSVHAELKKRSCLNNMSCVLEM